MTSVVFNFNAELEQSSCGFQIYDVFSILIKSENPNLKGDENFFSSFTHLLVMDDVVISIVVSNCGCSPKVMLAGEGEG